MNKIKKMENFFYLDIELKKLINYLNPNSFPKIRLSLYEKDVLNGIETSRTVLLKMAEIFNFSDTIVKRITFFFDVILEEAYKTKNESDFQEFVFKRIHNLNYSFIKEVMLNCAGYDPRNKYDNDPILEYLLEHASSINEFLYTIHTYIMNNEKYYQSINAIASKKSIGDEPIKLRGVKNELGLALFNTFPTDKTIGCTDILNLDKKILIMIRDKGHALTIDINLENLDSILVNYYIPKICNLEMANKIKGINKPIKLFQGATGKFETDLNNFINDVINFINSVPSDLDINIEEIKTSK